MSIDQVNELATLLREVAKLHRQTVLQAIDKDADWPIWYADHLLDKVNDSFGFNITKSALIQCLMKAEVEHQARAPESDWAEYYAGMFIEHLSPPSEKKTRLILYYFERCPFCVMVQNTIKRYSIDIEYRNILDNPQDRQDLMEARGRTTVPVLRIITSESDRWMPESRDIIRFLEARHG